MLKTLAVLCVLAAGVVFIVGCSKSGGDGNVTPEAGRLSEIHEIYTSYVKKNQAPPKQFSDINSRTYSEEYPGAFGAIKEGKYVVVWGISGTDSSTVLAYPKEAAEKGGSVLMADGSIKEMTADQLQAAVKK